MISVERRVAGLPAPARLAVAAAGGAVLALSQPPVSAPVVLFLVLPPLAWLLDATAGARGAFGVGWAAGAGFFGAALFWIVDPFLVQPEIFGWMAPFAVTGMAGGLALFWAVPFALARVLRPAGLPRLLALAALWALSDYARGHVLTGFPWALPAYAWVGTPVIQVAALTGPFLLGLLTLVAGLLPALASWRAVAVAAAMVAAGWGFGAWRLAQPLPVRAEPLVVRLVQPNAVQAEKWLPGKEQEFWDRHIALTRAPADPRPDVVIWSETAAPFALGTRPDLQAEAAAAAQPGRLVTGVVRVEPGEGGERYFNSLAVLDADGNAVAVYDKHHLVPFGEYVPFGGLVARLGLPALETLTRGGFSPGPGPHLVA
ncbi:MAG: apolipoprotein N-acyltransferase, partial [Amaricoccus sp.]